MKIKNVHSDKQRVNNKTSKPCRALQIINEDNVKYLCCARGHVKILMVDGKVLINEIDGKAI